MANSNNNPQSVIPDVEYDVSGNFVTVPVPEGSDAGKVLGAISEGTVGWVEDQGAGVIQQQSDWTESDDTKVTFIKHKPTVDQTYNASSTNAQSGTAVAEAISGVNQVPAATSADAGKVLSVSDEGMPEWVEDQGGSTYTGGAGISIDANNAINVIAGKGIEIGESTMAQNVEVFIEEGTGDGKLYHFGKLDSNISVDWLSGGQRLVTLLHDYVIDPVNNCFYPAICAVDSNDPNSFDVTQRLVFDDLEIGWEENYLPAGQDFVVDSTSINETFSTISLADVLANPGDFVLTVIPYTYGTQELDLSHKFYMQGEAKEFVNTISLASSVSNSVKVKNPVPDNITDNDKILISHGSSFAPEWGELQPGQGTDVEGLRVDVKAGRGLEIGDDRMVNVKAGSGLVIGQDTVEGFWNAPVESMVPKSVDFLASMDATSPRPYGFDEISLADAINVQGTIKVRLTQTYTYDGSNDLGIVCVAVVAKDPNNQYGIDPSSRLFYSGYFVTGLTGTVPTGTELWFSAFDADSEGLSTITWQDVLDAPDNYVLALLAGDGMGDIDTTAKYTAQLSAMISNTFVGDYFEANFVQMQYPIPALAGNEGKVLAVNSVDAGYGLEWVNAGGGGTDQPLPAVANNTLRFQFEDTTYDPIPALAVTDGTWTVVDESRGIWDFTKTGSWVSAFENKITTTPCAVIDGHIGQYNTQLGKLFKGCSAITSFRAGTPRPGTDRNLDQMMYSCTGLKSFEIYAKESNAFNVGASMNGTFYGCSNLKSVTFTPLIGVNLAMRMEFNGPSTFQGCVLLEDISGLCIGSNSNGYYSSGYNIGNMFTDCESLKSVNHIFGSGSDSKGFYVPVENAVYAFYGCKCLESFSAPLYLWSSSASCDEMFAGCQSLEHVGIIDFNDKSTSMDYMFKGCTSLRDVTLVRTGNVSSMVSAFDTLISGTNPSSGSLTKLPVFDMSGATNVSYMFRGQKYTDGALAMYQQLSQQATPPTDTAGCFSNCGSITHAADLAQIPAAWGGTGA